MKMTNESDFIILNEKSSYMKAFVRSNTIQYIFCRTGNELLQTKERLLVLRNANA